MAAAAVIFVFREQIIDLIAEFYYEEEDFQLLSKELGGRFMVITLMLLCGIMLKGFREKHFSQLFNMIINSIQNRVNIIGTALIFVHIVHN